MKIKKRFMYREVELRIVEKDEPYMDSGQTVKVVKVIAPNGGTIPLTLRHKQTLKSIIEDTIKALDNFESLGANVIQELTKD